MVAELLVLNAPDAFQSGQPWEPPKSPTRLHGIALTAQDLQEDDEDAGEETHCKSQEVLRLLMKHRGIEAYTHAPYMVDQAYDDSNADHRRKDFTDRVVQRLREKGIHALRTFRLHLHAMDVDCIGAVPARTFEGALAHMGVRLKECEFERLTELFPHPDGDSLVDYVRILSFGVGNWSRQREEVVAEAFSCLSEKCPGGFLEANMLERYFQARALTEDLVPGMVEHESKQEFLKQWSDSNLAPDGVIRWHDFLDYYMDISLCFGRDQDFCELVCASWGINADDWLAKKVFRRYTNPDREDCLEFGDFLKMVGELDPTMTDDDAKAWYTAIDEDDSGEVTLDEFLSSKILKVKRLFDEFNVGENRTASKTTMLKILMSLNSCITPEEAEAVYAYADADNSGGIGFCEFLENNLLKLLQIFDDFDRKRCGSCSLADMRQLFLKLDPMLSESDVVSIYKAIDVDGSGEISFIEFCESNVLRAKALFDRYDTTRARCLTQFKFRELLTELDSTLTEKEIEVIYNLVMDLNDERVHLAGFLNPNVIKLKLLFDKYDQDRSRELDREEFRCMLQDIFKSCNEQEIEELVSILCPGEEGVSFTTYFCRFKEISRKHDLIHLAKRRASREKAKARGLVWTG